MNKIEAAVVLLPLLLLAVFGLRLASKTPQRLQRFVVGACWLYALASVGLWLAVRQTGDRWWPATVFLFGPRWVWSLPLIPLAIAAWRIRRQSFWVLMPTAWIVLFPLMGLCVPWRLAIPHPHGGPRLRVLTCNLHRQGAAALAAFIAEANPDVVAIQEWSARQAAPDLGRGEWHCCTNDELFLASRYPIRKVDDLAGRDWQKPGMAVCYELETPAGRVPFINLRLASPHSQLEDLRWRSPTGPGEVEANSRLRLDQSRLVSRYAAALGPTVVLAGDFNTPEDSGIFGQCWSRFSNAFSVAGCGFGRTYHTPWVATRIDHVLAGAAWRCRRCRVGPDIGSPHRPLVAELELRRQDR